MATQSGAKKKTARATRRGGVLERGGEFSEQLLEQIRDTEPIEAVRGFMESVDEPLPLAWPHRRRRGARGDRLGVEMSGKLGACSTTPDQRRPRRPGEARAARTRVEKDA